MDTEKARWVEKSYEKKMLDHAFYDAFSDRYADRSRLCRG